MTFYVSHDGTDHSSGYNLVLNTVLSIFLSLNISDVMTHNITAAGRCPMVNRRGQ
jgi:hypothetical protein